MRKPQDLELWISDRREIVIEVTVKEGETETDHTE